MKGVFMGILIFGAVIGVMFYMQDGKTSTAQEDSTTLTGKDDETIDTAPPTQEDNSSGEGTVIDESMKTFTLAEVSEHDTEEDCWLVLHEKVYDVTSFIPSHPGGPAIISGCGKDATASFESRPGSETAHSDTARTLLPSFYIGDLAIQ